MIRRVVTGHRDGKAVVLGDGIPARTHVFESYKGMAASFAWAEPAQSEVGAVSVAETVTDETLMLPAPGESRLVMMAVPPDSWALGDDFDPAAAGVEFAEHYGEMAALMEADNPGMHRTDSVDYVFVLRGEVSLELDDQETVHLKASDVVIQNGTRHAWRNTTDTVALLAYVIIGATRVDA